eukprot:tig00020510_g9807.t1
MFEFAADPVLHPRARAALRIRLAVGIQRRRRCSLPCHGRWRRRSAASPAGVNIACEPFAESAVVLRAESGGEAPPAPAAAESPKSDVHLQDDAATAPTPSYDWHKNWYPVAFVEDFPAGVPVRFSLFDEPLVLWSAADGAVRCVADRCPHRAVPLSEGRVVPEDEPGAGALECGYHGWQFNGAGECTRVPQLPAGVAVNGQRTCAAAHAVVVRQGVVFVWGEAGAAGDESSIPTSELLERPGVTSVDFVRDLAFLNAKLIGNRYASGPLPLRFLERPEPGRAGLFMAAFELGPQLQLPDGNLVLDQDLVLLMEQEARLRPGGYDWRREWYVPAGCDAFVAAFRLWMERELLDRYEQHVRLCSSCSPALLASPALYGRVGPVPEAAAAAAAAPAFAAGAVLLALACAAALPPLRALEKRFFYFPEGLDKNRAPATRKELNMIRARFASMAAAKKD